MQTLPPVIGDLGQLTYDPWPQSQLCGYFWLQSPDTPRLKPQFPASPSPVGPLIRLNLAQREPPVD